MTWFQAGGIHDRRGHRSLFAPRYICSTAHRLLSAFGRASLFVLPFSPDEEGRVVLDTAPGAS